MKNDSPLSPDDPRITAYALGELDADDRAWVEAAIRGDPSLRATIEGVRGTAARLEAALASEPEFAPGDAAELTPLGVLNGHAQPDGAASPEDEYRRPARGPLGTLTRFPQFYYVISGLAAACFAVMVALRGPQPQQQAPVRHYVEIPLAPIDSVPVIEALAAADAATTESASETAVITKVPAQAVSGSRTLSRFAPASAGLLEASRIVSAGAAPRWSDTSAGSAPLPAIPSARPGSTSPIASWQSKPAGTFSFNPDALHLSSDAGAAQRVTNMNFGNSGSERSRPGARPTVASGTMPFTAGRTFYDASAGVQRSLADLRSGVGLAGGFLGSRNGRMVTGPLDDLFPGPRPTPRAEPNTEAYAFIGDNPFLSALHNPLSTFAADTDSASYANVRRMITAGVRPPVDAVRIEELVNYFPYAYPAPPAGSATPFAASIEVASAPWAPAHRLVRIGLKGRELAATATPAAAERSAEPARRNAGAAPGTPTTGRPVANLVFLLDVSGSMDRPNKLPLVKESMEGLLRKLRPDDRVAIVTYAGASELALPSTPVAQARVILDAIDALRPEGSTNGRMGIELAYDIAKANFAANGINRIILCTDGDFNVGPSGDGELARLIQEKARTGVYLTALGFGMGNLKDSTLELLADRGNGQYGYIDTRAEAEKLLVEQLEGTLVTIAKDVKVQVDFNPARVLSYRLIGYENRNLTKEDFTDDRVDAGEIGAGHTVTALYEVVPVGVSDSSAAEMPAESKYQPRTTLRVPVPYVNELLTVKLRYKEPDGDVSKPVEFAVTDENRAFIEASAEFRFAAAVAAFGMVLRDSPHKGTATMRDVVAWAATAARSAAEDPKGYRSDFVGLARQAQALLQ